MTEVKDTNEENINNEAVAEEAVAPVVEVAEAVMTEKSGREDRDNRQGGNKRSMTKNRRPDKRPAQSEFEQGIIDLARVTRVMAGGKRMRFRACIVIGNKKGKIGIGLAKGADVTLAINKAVNQAKKQMIDIQITNGTIAHSIQHKWGAAEILLRPAKKGRGIICGGVMRTIMEMAGIHNVTGKIMGTNNKVSNAKCIMEALSKIKQVKVREEKNARKEKKEGRENNQEQKNSETEVEVDNKKTK